MEPGTVFNQPEIREAIPYLWRGIPADRNIEMPGMRRRNGDFKGKQQKGWRKQTQADLLCLRELEE